MFRSNRDAKYQLACGCHCRPHAPPNVFEQDAGSAKRANNAQMGEAARSAAGKRRSRRRGRTLGAQARHPRDILAIVVAHVIVKGHAVARQISTAFGDPAGVEDILDLLTAPVPASRSALVRARWVSEWRCSPSRFDRPAFRRSGSIRTNRIQTGTERDGDTPRVRWTIR